jgi:hydroxymethylpyrimidine/phosphomethylpyrimidine kinase
VAGLGAIPIALTIAGSDSGGGAGIQADLKTFSAFGVYGASVITALTAQNTRGVQDVEFINPAFVLEQMESVLSDMDVRAVKSGMLATAQIIMAVAGRLSASPDIPLVVDPVMVATSGDPLLVGNAIDAFKTMLFPRARLITPNLPEAAKILHTSEARDHDEVIAQGKAMVALGARAVLMKDGHGTGSEVVDVLIDGDQIHQFSRPRIAAKNTHGTGCTLSAAIAALLAKDVPLPDAVKRAQSYVWHGINAGARLGVGTGNGPVDHLWALRSGVTLQ